MNDNGCLFDATHYAKLIHNEQVQGTPRLYTLLLQQYAYHQAQLNRGNDMHHSFVDIAVQATQPV
jgi:hypothetical protein